MTPKEDYQGSRDWRLGRIFKEISLKGACLFSLSHRECGKDALSFMSSLEGVGFKETTLKERRLGLVCEQQETGHQSQWVVQKETDAL